MTFLHDDLTLTQLLINSDYLPNQLELLKKAQQEGQASSTSIVNKLIDNLQNQLFSSSEHETDPKMGKFYDQDLLNLNNFIFAIFRDITKYNGTPIVDHKDRSLSPNANYVPFGDYQVSVQGFGNLLTRLKQQADQSNNKLLKLRVANLVKEVSQNKELSTVLSTPATQQGAGSAVSSGTSGSVDEATGQEQKTPANKAQKMTAKEGEEIMPFRKSSQGIFSIADIQHFFEKMAIEYQGNTYLYDFFSTSKTTIAGFVERWKENIRQQMATHPGVQMLANDISFGTMTDAPKIYTLMNENFGIYTKGSLQALYDLAEFTGQALSTMIAYGGAITETLGKDNLQYQQRIANTYAQSFLTAINRVPTSPGGR